MLFGCGSEPGDDDQLTITCTNVGGNQICTIVQGPISTGVCTSAEGGEAPSIGGGGGSDCTPGDLVGGVQP